MLFFKRASVLISLPRNTKGSERSRKSAVNSKCRARRHAGPIGKLQRPHLRLDARFVDQFGAAAAIQGVKLSPRPQRSGPDDVSNDLFERCRRKLGDLGKPESAAIAVGAILDRSPQLSIDRNEIACRPRGGSINHHRVAFERYPRTEQLASIKQRQRVRIPARPVTRGTEKVKDPIAPDDGRVSQFQSGKQRSVAFPPVWKVDAFVQRDVPFPRLLGYHLYSFAV